jgi:DNA-binding MarR family transcriptional regulator
VADKLVVRQPDAHDRRSFLVRLTPKGESRFAAMAKAHQEWVSKILSDFDGQETEAVIQHLDALPNRVRNEGARP